MPDWRISAEDAGRRLDQVVAEQLQVARNQVQRWIDDGQVEVDGVRRRPSFRVTEGDAVLCRPAPRETASTVVAEEGELTVLFADEHLLVVDKPAGIAVHPGAGRPSGTLVNYLIGAYPELGSVGGEGRPGVVHRLDLGTTGVMVLARSEVAYQALSEAFAGREVDKHYLGIVFGRPSPPSGTIELPIGRHRTRRREMAIRDGGRPARTDYRTVAEADGVALSTFVLHTGRTHQIRVHLKAVGHPLVGDELYAGRRWRSAPAAARQAAESFGRPALHAWRLGFEHPVEGRTVRFEAPVPDDLSGLWSDLGGRWPTL